MQSDRVICDKPLHLQCCEQACLEGANLGHMQLMPADQACALNMLVIDRA